MQINNYFSSNTWSSINKKNNWFSYSDKKVYCSICKKPINESEKSRCITISDLGAEKELFIHNHCYFNQ